MRLTKEYLQNAARELVAERVRREHDLLAVYLCGSVLDEEPLLGDSGDIDLVFIHYETPVRGREAVRLNDQIHLDILHHTPAVYNQPRLLRQHPWLGPTVYGCKVMYDPQHFMDFTVAGVRGQFDLPENVYQRAWNQAQRARRTWEELSAGTGAPGAQHVWKYLAALENAANAVVSLSGPPLTERRFMVEFPAYAQQIGVPGLAIGLLGLLGAMDLEKRLLENWIPIWEETYRALSGSKDVPVEVSEPRFGYYRQALGVLLNGPLPAAALWPLLRTWTRLAGNQPAESPYGQGWENVSRYLSLLGDDFTQRVIALDSYLDTIEEIIDQWGRERGALS